jgi:hypothetical protein
MSAKEPLLSLKIANDEVARDTQRFLQASVLVIQRRL